MGTINVDFLPDLNTRHDDDLDRRVRALTTVTPPAEPDRRCVPTLLVPELDVTDLERSLRFYRDVCGFEVAYERPDEGFACMRRGFGVELMLQSAEGLGRRFRTAPLEPPFGRGMNLQIEIDAVDGLYERVIEADALVVLDLEERWHETDYGSAGSWQFVVADPDGYLLRFYSDLGTRQLSPRD